MSVATPFSSPRARRNARSTAPLAVLVVIALLPAAALFFVYRWVDRRADIAASNQPAPADTGIPLPPAGVALNTPLTSMRRTAPLVSLELNLAAFQQVSQPLMASLNDRSCATIRLGDVSVAERDPTRVVIPASVAKVLTASVALEILGPDFTYKTTVVGPAPNGGVITGDVYLVGGGDPLLAGDWYKSAHLDLHPAFNTTSLDELARNLKAAGVNKIDGKVIGDGQRYDDEFYAPGWSDGVNGLEAGPYDALLVNDARVKGQDQRAKDPNVAGATEFARILAESGVEVTGGAAAGAAPAGQTELASVSSMPLPAVIAEMLTNSDNNTAELMLKEIGFAASGTGSREAGLAVMQSTIAGWGIDTTGLSLKDGSGLNSMDTVTCKVMADVLSHVGYDSAVGQGMAVAGQSGTLIDVFADTPVAGKLHGKTGSLNNAPFNADPPAVKSLVGYLPVAGGSTIEFTLLLNGPTISDQSEYRPIWAELVKTLTSFPGVVDPAVIGPR